MRFDFFLLSRDTRAEFTVPESVLTFSPAISRWRRLSGKSDRVGSDTKRTGETREKEIFPPDSWVRLGVCRMAELIESTHRHASGIASKL